MAGVARSRDMSNKCGEHNPSEAVHGATMFSSCVATSERKALLFQTEIAPQAVNLLCVHPAPNTLTEGVLYYRLRRESHELLLIEEEV